MENTKMHFPNIRQENIDIRNLTIALGAALSAVSGGINSLLAFEAFREQLASDIGDKRMELDAQQQQRLILNVKKICETERLLSQV